MLECLVSFNLVENMFGHTFDPPTGQWSYTRSANPNRKPFPTKDGYIGLLPYTDQQWDQFFEIAGWSETISKDPRFADFRTRAANIGALYEMVDVVTKTRTTAEWLELLKPLQIPVVKMNRFDDLFDDPHLDAVGLFEQRQHPEAGPYVSIRPPLKFSASPANIRRHPPRLGQHTEEVLAEIEEKDTAE
ncbi:MAG TPA: CoA transferase, partial [Caulobacteraceae bacterium]|nr:CoA transferase [Caulobacteraceae bacterium]